MDSFKDKRALITGAGQGIGRGIAVDLAKRGCKVVALSRTVKHLDSLKQEMPEIEVINIDISNWKETEKVVRNLGHFDFLVNNAGVASLQNVGEITEEEFDRGKRALVTGASQGIGKAIVIDLIKRGAYVIALSRTQKNLDQLKKEVPEVETVCCDVSKWKETEEVIKSLGDIDLLVNNAGVITLQSVGSITEEEMDWCFSINVKAVVNISQTVANNMKKHNKGGSIVNISSQTAMIAIEKHATYSASKGALDQLTKVMALELSPYQIRVNSVNPTVVLTEMGKKALGNEAEDKKAKIPLGRFCVANDIVGAVVFLLSDQASMITGACLPIDGGYTIQ